MPAGVSVRATALSEALTLPPGPMSGRMTLAWVLTGTKPPLLSTATDTPRAA